MTTIKQGKVQFTFLIDPDVYERVKTEKYERAQALHRDISSGEVMREAIEFFFAELNQRNKRHPWLHKSSPSGRQRAA